MGTSGHVLYKIKYKRVSDIYSQILACHLFNMVLYYARKRITNYKIIKTILGKQIVKEDFFNG